MTNIKFDPFRGFDSLTKKMNTVLNDMDKGFNVEFGAFAPRVDITEDEQKLHFDFELAGVDKKDVKVTINDENVLVVKGIKNRVKKYSNGVEGKNINDISTNVENKLEEGNSDNVNDKNDKNDKNEIYFLKIERNFGEFTRSFVLPDNINKDSIEAKYENGVLHLTFDKMIPEKPKVKEVTIN